MVVREWTGDRLVACLWCSKAIRVEGLLLAHELMQFAPEVLALLRGDLSGSRKRGDFVPDVFEERVELVQGEAVVRVGIV